MTSKVYIVTMYKAAPGHITDVIDRAFMSEQKAKAFCEKKNKKMNEHFEAGKSWYDRKYSYKMVYLRDAENSSTEAPAETEAA